MVAIGHLNIYHCHSEYSLLDSVTHIQEYVDLAKRDGATCLSISEHGKPRNWTAKWAACKDAGIKYIHSVEIYLTRSLLNDTGEKIRDNYHTVLMAKNYDGLLELNSLVSRSGDEDHFYYVNRLSFDEFLNISDNIITTSACLASPLNKLDKDDPYYEKLAQKYTFLEVQAHLNDDQIRFNRELLELSKKYNKPLIAGTDTHSSTEYKAMCRKILMEAKHQPYGDEDSFDLTWKTYDELGDLFFKQGALPVEEYTKAMDNTQMLDEITEEIELDTSIKYPILYGSREKDSEVFLQTVERDFKDKLDKGIITKDEEQQFRDDIKEEIRVFQKLHMDGFMLAMSEQITWCKQNGIVIGPGRGSVGGSRVAYVTNITEIDPVKWNLVFSRFCNEYREEIGDVDVDCIESDRPRIFKYIIDRFGKDYTARVASFGTAQDKDAIDIIGRALSYEWKDNHGEDDSDNPYSIPRVKKIKEEYEKDKDSAKKKYAELFTFFDGICGIIKSQSVHPAGMVISPITLPDHFGVFNKDGDSCIMLDMDNVHDYTGLAKFDYLILGTIEQIRDACKSSGINYPKGYDVDFTDPKVWENMSTSPVGLFQFTSSFAFDCLKRFSPKSIDDLSLVTACIRPTGASYRDDLLSRKPHKNPSKMIDDLLSDSYGYLTYQEQTIAFLQKICGLSGGEADNVRRAIGRKQKDRLDAAMPKIKQGYLSKSDKPKEEAEKELMEFLQVIEDSASYQFGKNHSYEYCYITYYCAWLRTYYDIQFLTAFLNDTDKPDDIDAGIRYAGRIGIRVTPPKFGISRAKYSFDLDKRIIAKGMDSINGIGKSVANELYELSKTHNYTHFSDLLCDIVSLTSVHSDQVKQLIRVDFFSQFGNERELLRLYYIFYIKFKGGKVKTVTPSEFAGTELEKAVFGNCITDNKDGTKKLARYKIVMFRRMMRDIEDAVLAAHMPDMALSDKVKDFKDVMGYYGYITGKDADRPLLVVTDMFPLKRKKDGKQFGYSIIAKSVGSGKETRYSVFNRVYDLDPVKKGDLIRILGWCKEGQYYQMTAYRREM